MMKVRISKPHTFLIKMHPERFNCSTRMQPLTRCRIYGLHITRFDTQPVILLRVQFYTNEEMSVWIIPSESSAAARPLAMGLSGGAPSRWLSRRAHRFYVGDGADRPHTC